MLKIYHRSQACFWKFQLTQSDNRLREGLGGIYQVTGRAASVTLDLCYQETQEETLKAVWGFYFTDS